MELRMPMGCKQFTVSWGWRMGLSSAPFMGALGFLRMKGAL